MATVRQYAAWCERRIAATVVAECLRVALLGVVQGPLTLTYRVRLLQPSPGALRRLLAMGPALAAAVQAPAVRVQQGEGAVLIELPLPAGAQRTPAATELAAYSAGPKVCVGYDALRRPVHVDLRQHGAIFWIGPSRRGKTQSMKCTLYALARGSSRLRFAILSQKRADWLPFEHAAGCLGLVSKPTEALAVLSWAADLLQERAESGGGPPYVIVADDLLNLLAAQPELAEPLSEIASMGAGLGVHLLAGTQEGGSKRGTGGAGVEANATARLLYRSSSAAAGARAAGQGGAGLEALSGAKGDALLLLDGEANRVATGWINDADILQLPAGSERNRAPWRVVAATGSQPLTTGRNQLQPAQPATVPPHDPANVGSGEGASAQPVEPVAAVAAKAFPIDKRPPTEAERELIRQLHAAGCSLNRLTVIVYGHKDGKGFAWVKEALSKSATSDPEAIDLSTDAGKAAMQALLAGKQIDWSATVSQLERRRLN